MHFRSFQYYNKMLHIKLLFILLSISLACCLRFDYYKRYNPALIQRRSEELAKDDQRYHHLAGFKNNEGHEKESHKDTADKGKHDKEHYKKHFGSDGGHKGEKHSEHADEHAHKAKAESQKGAKFSQKKGHKKGHKTKGWHNMFFRDEYHKEHRFYDDEHKSGEYEKHGAAHEKFHKNQGAAKKGGQQRSKYVHKKKGKKGHHNSGRNEEELKGYKHKQGDEKKHHNEEQYGKSGKGHGGKHYAYKDRH